MNESIVKMKMTLGNASLPEIFALMETVGYTAEKIAGMTAELSQLETLGQGQIKEYADQDAEQEKFDLKRSEINDIFNKHRSLTRVLFKGDIHACVAFATGYCQPKSIFNLGAIAHKPLCTNSCNASFISKSTKRGNDHKQTQLQSNSEFTIPTKLGGIELSEADQTQLKAGETIYIYGMKDREGQEYNAYVKVNPEENKLNF